MDFTKMQGAANDFVLIETDDAQREWSTLTKAMCDRHLGVGADSLLLLLPSDKADFGMRIFDADGSEAEACGNGIRCLAKYVFERGLISTETNRIMVETIAGIRKIELEKRGGKLVKIWANMGKPEFAADKIPVTIKSGGDNVVDINSMLSYKTNVDNTDLTLNLVSMGNPHAVYFHHEPVSEFPLSRIGPQVENMAVFPNRINFEVVRVLSPKHLEVRVWERGVGETLACGSGACATAVASKLLGHTERKVDIKLPGGTLDVEWNGAGEVILGGPAEIVFEGKWPD
jgi:diaminopimelate epimerase